MSLRLHKSCCEGFEIREINIVFVFLQQKKRDPLSISFSQAQVCFAVWVSSYTIYGLSTVQVAEMLLGHTCQLIPPLDYVLHCLQP